MTDQAIHQRKYRDRRAAEGKRYYTPLLSDADVANVFKLARARGAAGVGSNTAAVKWAVETLAREAEKET